MKLSKIHHCLFAACLVLAGNSSAEIAQTPLFLVQSARPMVMLTMSVDHQLFKKAFADYSDLNGDGVLDNSYTDGFSYYGYFDNTRCYSYNAAGHFEPEAEAAGPNGHHCDAVDGDWSGNFLNWATMTRIDVLRKALYGGKRAYDEDDGTILERALLPNDVHAFVKVFTSLEMHKYTPYAATTISLCNSTPVAGGRSQTVDTDTDHPKMRVAKGGWGRWAADEEYQCEWRGNGVSPATADNLFGAGSAAPSVRVKACVAGKLEANCRAYGAATAAKPIGLLQEYGEDGTLRFGLLSGSYANRDDGGRLRKGISDLVGDADAADEIDLETGIFTGAAGIISTLNRVRMNEWDYSTHKYVDCNKPGISIGEYLDGDYRCTNWGNPVSELYLEAVRYLSGQGSATNGFTNGGADPLGLVTAAWKDPMPATEWCAPMNVVMLSSGDNSFDMDDPSIALFNDWTDEIGVHEGLVGKKVFIGDNGVDGAANPDANICSAKAFTSLSAMRGLCPATPTKQGGYGIAGIAHMAHVEDLRIDRLNDPVTGKGQSIETFAVALAKNLPDFSFPIGDGGRIVVVPNAYASSGAIEVDDPSWKASSLAQLNVEETAYDTTDPSDPKLTYVRFLAHWEDSAWGNDYDMDAISRISICVGAECAKHDDDGDGVLDGIPAKPLRVTTRLMHANAEYSLKLGFVVSGGDADGDYTNLIKLPGVDGNFSSFDNDPLRDGSEPLPEVEEFSVAAAGSAEALPTPLQLAAKYGGFKDLDDNDLPDDGEWDGSNFFFADDPSQLGPRLASFLNAVATTSSASAVVANSVAFQSSTRIYQARFNSFDWSGQLLSFKLDVDTGAVIEPPEWDAATVISGQDYHAGREILTWNPATGSGVPFRWADLSATQQSLLGGSPPAAAPDGEGPNRLNYLRGDTSREMSNGGIFRDRAGLLGDNVNSSPAVVGAPGFGHIEALEVVPYSTFVDAYDAVDCDLDAREREPIVYFGANDGMLHGVSACDGKEWIGYVPNAVMANLPKLTSPAYEHRYYVDGSPTVMDAFWSDAWHTVLVGSTRAGGKGVFALDITDPSRFDEGSASDIVLWEIDSSHPNFPELGYTFSQPAVVKTAKFGWVSIFGNGYDSASGKAVIYVVGINDGIRKAVIPLGNLADNGVPTVAPVDIDNDGLIDLIYAGDLQGNIWRIAAGRNGFSAPSKLYQAKDSTGAPQPITTRVEVGLHPTSVTGRMVYFGTGKYYETTDGDPAASGANAMYGIWDRDDGKTIGSVTIRNAQYLQQQTIERQESKSFPENSDNTYDIRVLSNHSVTWITPDAGICGSTNAAGDYLQCGWYLDLPDEGEKMVADPILRGGRLIFVTTIPSTAACDAGGESWLMEIDASTGGRLDQPVFDLNGDGVFDFDDNYAAGEGGASEPVSGKKSKVGILQPPAIVAGVGGEGTGGFGKAEAKYSSGSRGGEIDVTVEDGGLPSAGRKSWIQFK